MLRSAGPALVCTSVLAVLAGCAYQDAFDLPDLTPRGASSGLQVYAGYGPGYGHGYGTGYPGVYQPGYDYGYGYVDPRYAAQGPYPYGYGYAYGPIPRYIVVPCADSNRDGRCDARPPQQHHDQDQHDDDDDLPARPRPGYRGEVPRVRDGNGRNVAPASQQRAVPIPATVRQPRGQDRPEPRRVTPPEAADQRGPRAGSGRASTTGNDVVSSRPTQEP